MAYSFHYHQENLIDIHDLIVSLRLLLFENPFLLFRRQILLANRGVESYYANPAWDGIHPLHITKKTASADLPISLHTRVLIVINDKSSA